MERRYKLLKKAEEKSQSENSPEFIYKVRGSPFALKIVKLQHKESKKLVKARIVVNYY